MTYITLDQIVAGGTRALPELGCRVPGRIVPNVGQSPPAGVH